MTTQTTSSMSTQIQPPKRPPFYRDATVVKWIVQIVALAAVIFALVFLSNVAGDNLAAKDISTSFDFLSIDPGISLSEGIDTEPATGGRAIWVGMVNTLRLAITGIIFATLLGVFIGLARLSNNWILNKIGTVFVETLRNIPLLVQILIYAAILTALDRISLDTGPINGWLHISNKGVSVPRVFIADGFYQWMVFIIAGLIIGNFVRRSRQRTQDDTGATTYPGLSMLGVVAVFGLIGWFLHPIFGWLDGPFDAIAGFIDGIPQQIVQIALTVLAVGLAANWIRRFLDSRRTPAGLAKLTDDDWFRMIFAGVGAAVAALFIWLIWPGGSSWLVNSSRDLFELASDKFGADRGNWRTDPPIDALRPDIAEGRFANPGPAGLNFSVGFAAVFFGIVLYTAAFVAEIVRGGILAVPKGQTEAAQAIGLKRTTMLRQVILPQAFRVSLPPLGNQYLNLTKNTSLAVAVGATDLVQVGQTIYNQSGKSLEVFSIWMLFYLACSLTISVIVNFFNVRLAIVER